MLIQKIVVLKDAKIKPINYKFQLKTLHRSVLLCNFYLKEEKSEISEKEQTTKSTKKCVSPQPDSQETVTRDLEPISKRKNTPNEIYKRKAVYQTSVANH